MKCTHLLVLVLVLVLGLAATTAAQAPGVIQIDRRFPECPDPWSVSYFYMSPTAYEDALVHRVLDGRTFEARLRNGKTIVVRVAGVQAVHSSPEAGQRAREFLSALVLGKRLDILEYGYESDDFEKRRAIDARVMVGSLDVAMKLLEAGYANVEPSDHVGHLEACEYRQTAARAKNGQRGLWGQ